MRSATPPTNAHCTRIGPSALVVAAAACVLIALGSCSGGNKHASSQPAEAPPPDVVVAPVVQKTVPIYGEFVGQTQAVNTVDIRSQVTGFLQKIAFREGSVVSKGELLFVIDPRPFQAALAATKATLAQDQAVLEKANRDLQMYGPALQKHAISVQQYNTAVAAEKEAAANVKVAEANVATAQLNLAYTQIRAPIRGGIGVAQVRIGDLIQAGTTLMDTIYSINPMWVNFSVSEASYLAYRERVEQEHGKVPPSPAIQLILANGITYPYPGTINMVAPQVNATTGTLAIRASFPNPQGLLKAGLFVRVHFVMREEQNALLIPQTAVQQLQGTTSVFIVGPDNKVRFQSISVGPTVDHLQVATSGLQAGERVIVQGTQKVRPGMTVRPVEQTTPTQSAADSHANTSGRQ